MKFTNKSLKGEGWDKKKLRKKLKKISWKKVKIGRNDGKKIFR